MNSAYIAAVIPTVLDELAFLRRNLLYHRFLGVDRFYIYDDGSNDDTMRSVADLPYVEIRPSVSVSEVEINPYLARAAESYSTHFVARQMLNMAHAMSLAKRAGTSWMIGFDADELVVIDRSRPVEGALSQLLRSLPESIDAATFRPLEVVQRRLSYNDVLTEETLFKIAAAGDTRDTYDPTTGQSHSIDAVYGHKAGKQAVRLSLNPIPFSVHRFRTADGKKLRAAEKGDLLHFYAPDFESFVRKFRGMKDHPDDHVDGRTVVLQKRLWRDVVNRSGMSDDELRDYYERWVMFDDDQLAALRGRKIFPFGRGPSLAEVTSAADALRWIDAEEAGAPQARLAG